MPFLSRSSSSHRSIPSEGSSLSRENGIINHKDYAALDFNRYTEKPLSKQLGPTAVDEMGCRLPGNVSSPAQFWDMMMNKRTAPHSTVPSLRFKIDAHLHPNNDRPGSFNVPGGYFLLGSLHEFDPGLFNISPVKDMWMDPQQQKLLEVVYETFESTGVGLAEMENSKTGGIVGSFTSDFQQISFKEPDFRHSYAATGVDPGIISARISHVFNLHGPSLTLHTACSSSVYALHQACNALRNKELNWDDWNVKVPCEPQHFPAHLPVRRVSVNSFRYGGTNGHFIVEGAESLVPGYSHGQKKQKLIKGSDRGVKPMPGLEALEDTIAGFDHATAINVDPSLELEAQGLKAGQFDLIIPGTLTYSPKHASLLAPGGRIVSDQSTLSSLRKDFSILNLSNGLAIATAVEEQKTSSTNGVHTRSIAILYRNKPTEVPCKLVKACNALGSSRLARLADASIATSEHVVVTCDLDGPLLLELEPSELSGLQNIVSNPSSVTWVTVGGLMKGATPEQAMASGVARSVTSEMASLDFTTLDRDLGSTTTDCDINEIVRALDRQIYHAKGKESEYCLADGLTTLARVEAGEIVLILHRTGYAGAAAITISKKTKAQTYVAVRSVEEAARVAAAFDLPADNIIPQLDSNLMMRLKERTGGYVADVIFSSAYISPTISHECRRQIAAFGSFIEQREVFYNVNRLTLAS